VQLASFGGVASLSLGEVVGHGDDRSIGLGLRSVANWIADSTEGDYTDAIVRPTRAT
jgi:hypothetical protein